MCPSHHFSDGRKVILASVTGRNIRLNVPDWPKCPTQRAKTGTQRPVDGRTGSWGSRYIKGTPHINLRHEKSIKRTTNSKWVCPTLSTLTSLIFLLFPPNSSELRYPFHFYYVIPLTLKQVPLLIDFEGNVLRAIPNFLLHAMPFIGERQCGGKSKK